MREKKRRLELISFYDHTGMEARFAEMAQKGWLIERMSNFLWTYCKIEPQELHFTVSYFPKANEFDPEPSQEQQRFFDFCRETGWQPVCTWFQMQVFCNAQENPTPVNTEPELEVEALHKACKASFLRSYRILFVLSLLLTLMFFSSLVSDTLRLIASPAALTFGACSLILFVQCSAELLAYGRWHKRAKKAAQYGMFLDTPSTHGIQKTCLALIVLWVAYWLVNVALAGSAVMAWSALFGMLWVTSAGVAAGAVKQVLKKAKAPSALNRALTAAAAFAVSLVLMGAAVRVGVFLLSDLPKEELPFETKAPLTLSDLSQTEGEQTLLTVSSGRSLLLSRLSVTEGPGFEQDASSGIPTLHYELYGTTKPSFYDFCKGQLKRLMVLSAHWKGEMRQEEASPWGAQEAWRLVLQNGTPANAWLLCYPGRLVRLELDWQPTAQQMRCVADALGQGA